MAAKVAANKAVKKAASVKTATPPVKQQKAPASVKPEKATTPASKKRKAPPAETIEQLPRSAKKAKSPTAAASSKDPQSLSEEQVAKAVGALCAHLASRESNDLLGEAGSLPVHVQIGLTMMPKGRGEGLTPKKHKPSIFKVPHPPRTLGECEVCLFTKDPQREFKDKLAAQGVERVKVIGVSKLKKKYVEFEAKRLLCASHEVFLSDNRVLPMLPKLIGKEFFRKNKQPAAVDLTVKNVREQLRVAVEGVRFLAPSGTLVSMTAGVVQQPQPELVANVMAVVAQAVPKLRNGWKGVQGIFIKSTDTIALPVYQKPISA